MHQDIRSGRRTEIAQINGAVVEYGHKLGIRTPVNSLLTDLVLALEQVQRMV
jgi:ketopantoate reductase